MKKIIILLLGIFMTISSFAKVLEGIGQGTSQEIAKKEALADLSNQIQVTVKSNFNSQKKLANGETSQNMSSQITTLSEIKILGVDFNVKKKWFKSEYTAIAKLDETKIVLYEKKTDELKNKINSNFLQGLEVEDLRQKKDYFLAALNSYEEFESYKNVAIILGSAKSYRLPYTKAEIKNKLQAVEKEMNSDSLYNGTNVLFVRSTGQFGDSSKEYFDNYFNTALASISQENNHKISVANKNNSTVTTLVKVVLNSNFTSTTPAVYYNKKLITPDTYETTLSITVELYNKKKVKSILTLTVTGKGSDINSKERSYEKAVKNGFAQMKDKLKEALIGK